MAGIDCGPGNASVARWTGIHPAPSESLAGMKRAERRVLKYCASQTSTGDWLPVSRREIVPACRISDRDFIPFLERLAARGLIRIMKNGHALKRTTQIKFLVEPCDLAKRLAGTPCHNGTTPCHNGTTMEHPEKMVPPPGQNGTTMEHLDVRIREVRDNLLCSETSIATIEEAIGA